MRLVHEIRERVRAVLFRRREEREMREEMRYHIERETEKNVREGMEPAEARRVALLRFGGVDRYQEEVRKARGVRPLEDLVADLRYAARTLRKAPGFTVVAVGTLAIAIGATTAVFTLVDGVLLRPLDFEDPERLVRILEFDADGGGRGTISADNFRDWIERTDVFEAASLYDEYRPSLEGDEPERVHAASVNAAYFDVLGIEPAVGRFFLPEEDEPGSDRAVLSWGLWQERFGGDPGVVGSTLHLGGFPYTVVGVAPRAMEDPGLQGASFDEPRLWRSTPTYFTTNGRGSRSFTAVARLREGVDVEAAEERLQAVHADLAVAYPDENRGKVVEVVPLKEDVVGDVRPALVALLAGVGLILLMACANVANLLLFRASGRTREISVRAALGARRGRIVRQLLSESLLLAVLGGLGGLALGWLATRGLVVLAGDELPRMDRVTMDLRVLAFAAITVLGVTILFGAAPAVDATRVDLAGGLASGGGARGGTEGGGAGRLRRALVAVEVALAVVVVAAGALLARSLLELRAVDPGIEVERLLVMEVDPPFDPYFNDEADTLGLRLEGLYRDVLRETRALPGVRSAGMIDILPLSGSFNGLPYRLDEEPAPALRSDAPQTELRAVVPDFFRTMGIPVVRGRGIVESDRADAPPVAVVNRTLARRHGGEAAVVGMHIHLYGDAPHRIVGVVGDVTEFSLQRAPEATTYIPVTQAPGWMRDEQKLVVRTAGDPVALAGAVRTVVRDVEPRAPVSDVTTMEGVLGSTLARERFRTVLLVSFALVALLLAAVGVFGMVSYGVGRRRRELGVRMAMGASRSDVSRLVVAEGLRPVVAGAIAGLVGAVMAGRALSGLLFGVAPTDPVTFTLTPVLLLAVAALAAWLPARRAGRLPVVEVLGAE